MKHVFHVGHLENVEQVFHLEQVFRLERVERMACAWSSAFVEVGSAMM